VPRAVALLAAILLGAACRDEADGARGYLTQAVDRGEITASILATGLVEPVAAVQVGTYVSGPIREIHVDYNSPVRTGQLVAKIDPAPFEVKVRQAEANLANARARVEKARADLRQKELSFERSRRLRERELISLDELDTSESQRAQAAAQLVLERAGVAQAEAALDEARINLAYTEIRSPVEGVVVSRSVEVGQTVAASFQTPTLFEIAQDLTRMQVNASVSESDIGGASEGQPATFTVDAWPGRRFEGRVVQVRNAPVSVQNVVTYGVVIEVANPDLALKPGMTATVTITTARRDDALRVPLRALRFRPEADGDAAPASAAPEAGSVYVVTEAGDARRVEVRLGIRDDRFAEVVAGELAAGDAVAVALASGSDAPGAAARSPFVPARTR